MSKFRAFLSIRGVKKDGKRDTGWLVIEDSGDIFIKNLMCSTPLGNISALYDYSIKKNKVQFFNDNNEKIVIYFNMKRDRIGFNKIIITSNLTTKSESKSSINILDQIRTLGELRDEELITNEEFESKKSELLNRL